MIYLGIWEDWWYPFLTNSYQFEVTLLLIVLTLLLQLISIWTAILIFFIFMTIFYYALDFTIFEPFEYIMKLESLKSVNIVVSMFLGMLFLILFCQVLVKHKHDWNTSLLFRFSFFGTLTCLLITINYN